MGGLGGFGGLEGLGGLGGLGGRHSCPNWWSLKIAGTEILSQHWN